MKGFQFVSFCSILVAMFCAHGFAELSHSVKNYCEMQDDPKACMQKQKELDENLKRTDTYNKAIKKEKEKQKKYD